MKFSFFYKVLLLLALVLTVGLAPTVAKASVTKEYRGQTTSVVEFWNYNYEWGLYERAQEEDLFFTLYLNDFAHRSPNMSVDFMVFGDGSPMALRGNSFHAYFEVYFDSQECGVYLTDNPEVLVYFMYDLKGDFEVSVAECDFSATDGSGDCYVTIDCSTVPADVYGFMVRLYDDVNTCWFKDWERSSSRVCVSPPYVGEITSTVREVVGGADEFYDEQLVWSENIFENIKILGEYIWNLPGRLWNTMVGTFTEWYESFEKWYLGLPSMFESFFDDLEAGVLSVGSSVAESIVSLFDDTGHSGGGTSFAPPEDDGLLDLEEFVPEEGGALMSFLNEVYSVDLIREFFVIVSVVGVVAFLIF